MKVSLCITSCYKDIHNLNKLIPYILSQTVSPDEIILFCSGVQNIDPSINMELQAKIFTNHVLFNPAQARNYCIDQSSKELLIFFDIDDFPHPQKIETTLNYIDNYDFLLHSYTINNTNFKTIADKLSTYSNLQINNNCTNISCESKNIHHAHIAVKRTVADRVRYDTNNFYYKKEDGKFCQDLLQNNYRGIYLDYPLVSYTI